VLALTSMTLHLQLPQKIQRSPNGNIAGHAFLAEIAHHLHRREVVFFMEIAERWGKVDIC